MWMAEAEVVYFVRPIGLVLQATNNNVLPKPSSRIFRAYKNHIRSPDSQPEGESDFKHSIEVTVTPKPQDFGERWLPCLN